MIKRTVNFVVFGIPIIVTVTISIAAFFCNIYLNWNLSWFLAGGILFIAVYGVWAFFIYDPIEKRGEK